MRKKKDGTLEVQVIDSSGSRGVTRRWLNPQEYGKDKFEVGHTYRNGDFNNNISSGPFWGDVHNWISKNNLWGKVSVK